MTESKNFQWTLCAFALALAARLFWLGHLPLADREAFWSLQAFDIAQGQAPLIGSNAGYVNLTAIIFYIFQANNFTARFVSALFGAALVFVPFLFRDKLGDKAALVLSFVFVFEPGLLALSRTAASPILAIASVLLAWGLYRNGSIKAAGIFAGLALLSGVSLWAGLIGLAAAFALATALPANSDDQSRLDPSAIKTSLIYAVGAYLALGSIMLLAPNGLSAGLSALPEYFSSWVAVGDVPAARLLIALAMTQPFGIILALIALARGVMDRDRVALSLSAWMIVALVSAIANPSRQAADLAWALIPLWTLASLEVSRMIAPIREGKIETIGMLMLALVILTFAWLDFASIANVPLEPSALQARWLVLGGALILLGLSTALIALGWSPAVAMQGTTWALLIVFAVHLFVSAMFTAGIRAERTTELWRNVPQVTQAEWIEKAANDLSQSGKGVDARLDVTVVGINSPALRWLFRNWEYAEAGAIPADQSPALVITRAEDSSLQLAESYRGEDFVWRSYPAWETAIPTDWLRWMITHQMPQGEEKIILWSRVNLFLNAEKMP